LEQAEEKNIAILTPIDFFRLLGERSDIDLRSAPHNYIIRNSSVDVEALLETEFQHQISFDRENIRKYSLEIAPNGKSKWDLVFRSFWLTSFRRCAHCHHNIVRGAPRIRVCFRSPNDWVYHRCLTCVTDQILANIKAEWMEFSDPLKAFVAAQPVEVIACFQNENPNMPQHTEAEGDQAYVVDKLYQYADAAKHAELTEVGQKRPLTTWKEGETIVVPVGKKTKKFPTEGYVIPLIEVISHLS
jgi:hypothetical protein